MPLEVSSTAFTEAVGYVQNNKFVGTMRLEYKFGFSKVSQQAQMLRQFGDITEKAEMNGLGQLKWSCNQPSNDSYDLTTQRDPSLFHPSFALLPAIASDLRLNMSDVIEMDAEFDAIRKNLNDAMRVRRLANDENGKDGLASGNAISSRVETFLGYLETLG